MLSFLQMLVMDVAGVTEMTTEQIFTFRQLWSRACTEYGRFVPYTTMRDWIMKACLLDFKDEYTEAEAACLSTWIEFQKRYPRRSTVKVKRFHEHMRTYATNP